METTIDKELRERVVIYLHPSIVTHLRRQHADERRSVSRVVEEILSTHFEESQPCPSSVN